jgi:hypothetical protein
MSRGSSKFRQSDVTRALKAAVAAGIDVAGYEIGADGSIRVTVRRSAESLPANPLDEWMAAHAGKA